MEQYSKQVEVRWSDLDPNFHLRHSVYYDWGAFVRLSFLNEHGLPPAVLMQHHLGPILFREECIFKREIKFGDSVAVNFELLKCRKDMSRWTMRHEIIKNADTLSATLTVDGAWMDTQHRRLAIPPEIIQNAFEIIPKAKEFDWEVYN